MSTDATQQPSGGTHPCPACDTTVAVATALDDGACPACGTDRSVIYELADGRSREEVLDT